VAAQRELSGEDIYFSITSPDGSRRYASNKKTTARKKDPAILHRWIFSFNQNRLVSELLSFWRQ
jgi:hypothetical protein